MQKPQLLGSARIGSWLGASLSLLFIPKCPLCVAAALYFLGMSATGAALAAPVIRPLAFALCAAFGVVVLGLEYRARARGRRARGAARDCGAAERPPACCGR